MSQGRGGGDPVRPEHSGLPRRRGDGCELRCLCGSLMARYVPEGVELMCRRCKRRVVVAVARGAREGCD